MYTAISVFLIYYAKLIKPVGGEYQFTGYSQDKSERPFATNKKGKITDTQ